eukprot:7001563-Alexandrium_andersonii.AAC.1
MPESPIARCPRVRSPDADRPMPESPVLGGAWPERVLGPSGYPASPESEESDVWVGLEADQFAPENLMPAPGGPS